MIFCNQCGNELPEGMGFCTECGAAIPTSPRGDSPPTLSMNFGLGGATTTPAREATLPAPPPQYPETNFNAPSAPPAAGTNSRLVMIIIGGVALAIVAAVIFIANSNSKTSDSASVNTSSSSVIEDSLQKAIDAGRFVTLGNDDAYTYFLQLKQSDPRSQKLNEIKSKVLPQLRNMGEEVIKQSASIQWKRLTERDWAITQRIYEWAHVLEPNDSSLEARLKYAQAETARIQENRYSEERGYMEAAQLDSNWALPQFRLGLLYMRRDRSDPNDRSALTRGQAAIPYFRRAIDLESNWELPYLSMGTAYYLQRDFDTAERYYRQAMEMNPNWGGPHAWMGAVYENTGRCHDAIYEYEKALELVSNDDSFDVVGTRNKIEQIRSKCY